jgi:hypothetical protein
MMYDIERVKEAACKVAGLNMEEYNMRRDTTSVFVRTMVSGFTYYYGGCNMTRMSRLQDKSYANEITTINRFNAYLETDPEFRKLYTSFLRELEVDSIHMEKYFDARRPDRIAYQRFARRIEDKLKNRCHINYAANGHDNVIADFYIPARKLMVFVVYGQYKVVQHPGNRSQNYFDQVFRMINSAVILGYKTLILLPSDVESFDSVARVKQFATEMESV